MSAWRRWTTSALARATPWRRRACVLLYHRVADAVADPWELAVTPGHFDEQMAVLRRRATVVRLSDLPDLLARRGAPRRCVAVTFDDGYADNLHAAVPSLERHDVPATVFVVAGAIGAREFWWDRLARLLLEPGTLPERLALTLDGVEREWLLGDWATYSAETWRAHRARPANAPPATARHALFLELWRWLQSADTEVRERTMDRIALWAGNTGCEGAGLTLTAAEVAALAAHPLVDIGGHTLSHPRLSALDAAAQRAEVAQGKRVLEQVTGRTLATFAYPFGRPADYDDDSVAAVRDAGFLSACVNSSGTVQATTDRYHLPRAYVRDCDGAAFERQLDGWLGAPAR